MLFWLSALTALAASAVCIAAGLRRGALAPLALFGLHAALGVPIRSIVLRYDPQAAMGFYGVLSRFASSEAAAILIQLAFAIAAVLVGYFLTSKRRADAFGRKAASIFDLSPSIKSQRIALYIFAAAWVIFLLVVSAEFGSPARAFALMQKRALIYGSDVAAVRKLTIVAAASLSVYAFNVGARLRVLTPFQIALAIGLIVLHSYGIAATGSRGAALTQLATLCFAFIVGAGTRQFRFNWKTLLFVFIAAPVISSVLVGGMAMRLSAQSGISPGSAVQMILPQAPSIVSSTFPLVELYGAAQHFADEEGVDFGRNYLGMATRVVPRAIWPSKPESLGVTLRQFYYGDRLSAVPPSVFGEFYIAGGIVTLLLGSMLFGVLLRLLTGFQEQLTVYPGAAAAYVYITMQICVGVVKSGFENSSFAILYFGGALFAITLIVRALGGAMSNPIAPRARPSGRTVSSAR